MTVKEQLELRNRVRAYQASLHPFELERRERLMKESTALLGRLTRRVVTFAPTDRAQADRSLGTLKRAAKRAERRETDYYGE